MNINEQLLVFYNNNLNTGIHDNQVMGGQGEKYPSSYYFSNGNYKQVVFLTIMVTI